MSDKPIRLSPSGPVIVNSGGAPLQPGTGLQLRMDETKATCGGVITTTAVELGGGNLRASLLNPNPALQYACEVQVNSWTQVNNGDQLRIQLQRATNLAADNWENLQFDLFESRISNAYSMAVAHQEMELGTSVRWDIPAGAEKLTVRAMISMTDTSEANEGTMPNFQGFIRLVELF